MLRFSLGFGGVLLALGLAYAIWKYIDEREGSEDGTRELREEENNDND